MLRGKTLFGENLLKLRMKISMLQARNHGTMAQINEGNGETSTILMPCKMTKPYHHNSQS